jgi:hypothetical protein
MTGTIDQGFQADTTTTRSAETPTAKKPKTARTPPTDTAPENPDATALGGAGRPLPLGDSGHQGDFGETFIRALAAAANLDALRADRDRAGVDWTLRYPAAHGRRGFPLIDVQVKSWSDPRGNDAAWRYPLEVKNYNWLAGRDYLVPRFLFLVVVPRQAAAWTDISAERLMLRHAAYWACFHDVLPLPGRNRSSTYTVRVPRANLLDIRALHGLFGDEFRELLAR